MYMYTMCIYVYIFIVYLCIYIEYGFVTMMFYSTCMIVHTHVLLCQLKSIYDNHDSNKIVQLMSVFEKYRKMGRTIEH